MEHKRVALTVSLPHDLARRFDRLAKTEAKNKSQLFRDMFQAYQQRRIELEFFELQRYGVRQARKKGILTEADVETLVLRGR